MFQRLMMNVIEQSGGGGDFRLYNTTHDNINNPKTGKFSIAKPNWAKGKPTYLIHSSASANETHWSFAVPFYNTGRYYFNGSTNAAYPATSATAATYLQIAEEDNDNWYFYMTTNNITKNSVFTLDFIVKTSE